jgi:hypothetical protein
MDATDVLIAAASFALAGVVAAIASVRARRRARRSQIETVGHLLHGPYRAANVRMFVTVDGKTTELKRVRLTMYPHDVDGVRW